jgi:ligand-binding sensor domain-containing protein
LVSSIAIDAEGNKWFGTWEGVSKFDGTTWTTYDTLDGLACNNVLAIAIDAEANKKTALVNKWFGTYGGGVSKFDGTNWTTYNSSNGLLCDLVHAIAIDVQGNKWFGTSGAHYWEGGISKFDGTNWTFYSTADGLVNHDVFAIAIDAEGSKWFGTLGGVSKLSDENTGTTKIINENHLNLYPNPVQNILHINLSGKTGALQVFDISGKCLLQKQIKENESSVDVSGLESGIYIVSVLYDSKIFTGKVVKY